MNTASLNYQKRKALDPLGVFVSTKKSYAKLRGIPFDLTPQYLAEIWTGVCPVLGTPLRPPMSGVGRGSHGPDCPHLDRIDPDKGYVRGNVAWLSGRANRIKYDATIEELEKLVVWLRHR